MVISVSKSMKLAFIVVFSTLTASWVSGQEPTAIPVKSLGTSYELLSQLNVFLGSVVTVEGTLVKEKPGAPEIDHSLLVHRINGVANQQDIRIGVFPYFFLFGEKDEKGTERLPKLRLGQHYRFEGYVTGGYYGVPDEAWDRAGIVMRTPIHQFVERLVIFKGEVIDKPRIVPKEFLGREALFSGEAKSTSGKGVLQGNGWSVVVIEEEWEHAIEGKTIEVQGRLERGERDGQYRLEEGVWRLVELKDQMGKDVKLRCLPRFDNPFGSGGRWVDYRGVPVFIEPKDTWLIEIPPKALLVSGKLTKGVPAVRKDSTQESKEFYILTEASANTLESLFIPEVIDHYLQQR